MTGQTHIVGPPIAWRDPEHGTLVRQRCSWCGALLRDEIPEQMMVAIDPDDPDPDTTIPDWPVGELMRLEGDGWPWIRSVIDAPIDEIAPDCCLLLDPEITR